MFEALVLDKAYQSAIGGWWALRPVAGTRRDVACFVPSALAGDGRNVVEYVYLGDLSSIPSFSFVEFGFAVFGWPRSRFWKGVPSPGSVPAVANSNPQGFSPGSGSGACDHAIGNLQAFYGGTCCVHELHDFLKIKRRDESCSSLMGNSSFQDLEVSGS